MSGGVALVNKERNNYHIAIMSHRGYAGGLQSTVTLSLSVSASDSIISGTKYRVLL